MTLEDYCLHITDGEHCSVKDDEQGKYYLLSNKNIIDGNVVVGNDERRISKDTFDKINKRILLEANDVLISTVGTLGKTAVVRSPINYTFQRSVGIIKPDPLKVDSYYLKYLLDTAPLQQQLLGMSSGAIQKCIFISTLKSLQIQLPDLSTQKQRAKVLRDIDEKININRRIIAKLEETIRKIYDYWFVQFDFPDINGKPYKSSGGTMIYNSQLKREIPTGWEVKTINDIAQVFNGATPSTSDASYYGGDVIWITPKDLSIQQSKFIIQGERNITVKGYNSCSTHLLPMNAILMSSRAPIGLFAIAKKELCTNQGFKSFVPKNEAFNTYLYYYLMQHKAKIEQLGTGTTFKEVSREDMLKFFTLLPPINILHEFEDKSKCICDEQLILQKEIAALIRQRDKLLPLLMNGQISVN